MNTCKGYATFCCMPLSLLSVLSSCLDPPSIHPICTVRSYVLHVHSYVLPMPTHGVNVLVCKVCNPIILLLLLQLKQGRPHCCVCRQSEGCPSEPGSCAAASGMSGTSAVSFQLGWPLNAIPAVQRAYLKARYSQNISVQMDVCLQKLQIMQAGLAQCVCKSKFDLLPIWHKGKPVESTRHQR